MSHFTDLTLKNSYYHWTCPGIYLPNHPSRYPDAHKPKPLPLQFKHPTKTCPSLGFLCSRVRSYHHNGNYFHLLHPPFIPVSKIPSLPTYQTARSYTDFNSQAQTHPTVSLPSLIPPPPSNNSNATLRWKPMCLYHTHGKCTKVKFQTFQLFISNYYCCWFPVLILLRMS